MRQRLSFALVGICLAFLASATGSAFARESPAPAPSAGPHSRGLLWKIERAGAPASYLFGTLHMADARVTALPPPVRQVFDAAASLTMELVPDAAALSHLLESMFFNDSRTLESIVGAELYADVRRAFAKRNLPATDLSKFKPWAVTVVLSMPVATGDPPLDMQLQLRAIENGKPVEGLETAQEQVAVFNDLSFAQQRALLETTLRHQDEFNAQLEAIVQAYLARDLARLQLLFEEQAPADRALHATLTERLLTSRNHRMVERLGARLKRGNVFIAVGAAHLPGPDGILQLLEREGYRVNAVY